MNIITILKNKIYLLNDRLKFNGRKFIQKIKNKFKILYLKNLNFRSSDSDIDLVQLEEFYEKASESISNIEVTKSDPHQLYLARLNYELHERKK